MKKYFYLLGALLLAGCSGQNKTIESTTVTELQTEAAQTEPATVIDSAESPSGTVTIPDQDGLLDKVVDVLIELDATDASIDSWERHLDASEPNMKAIYSLPDGKNSLLIVTTMI